MRAVVALGVSFASSLLLCGCDERNIACPEAWEDSQPNDHGCVPPAEVTDAANEALDTGIYGYAIGCSDEKEEGEASCPPGDVVGSCAFLLVGIDEHGEPRERTRVKVGADGTFARRLTAGLVYSPEAESGFGSLGYDGVTLDEGEVRFVRFHGTCD